MKSLKHFHLALPSHNTFFCIRYYFSNSHLMKKAVKYIWIIFFSGLFLGVLIILLANWGVFGKMPSIEELQNPSASLASQVYAADGTLMGKYYLEDRVNVDYKDISPYIRNALVATEDERFYDHNGIDPRSLARAVFSF